MLPDAPERLSTTNCWPSVSARPCAMMRATISVAPPGANGTIILTGLIGQSTARSAAFATLVVNAHAASNAARQRIPLLNVSPRFLTSRETLFGFQVRELDGLREPRVFVSDKLFEFSRRGRRRIGALA